MTIPTHHEQPAHFAYDQEVLNSSMGATRYLDIADQIRHMITVGSLRPGEQLPSETDLAHRYDVSMPTIRQSLGALQREGLVVKRHGRGNFVSLPYQRITYTNDKSAADVRASFNTTLRAAVSSVQIKADDRLVALLQVPRGSRISQYVYLSSQGSSPHSLAYIYVPADVAQLDMPATSRSPLGDDVRGKLNEAGIKISTTVERAAARLATPNEEKILRLGRGTAVLTIERMSMDAGGRVVEAALLILPGHRSEAVFTTHAPFQDLEATG
jgi:GntR family transcriptional regulator